MSVWISGTGVLTAGNIANGAITTPKLAGTTAITEDTINTTGSDISTSSTSYVLMAGQTYTFTATGAPLLIAFHADTYSNTAAGAACFQIVEGGNTYNVGINMSQTAVRYGCASASIIHTPAAAGTITIALYWKTASSGIITCPLSAGLAGLQFSYMELMI